MEVYTESALCSHAWLSQEIQIRDQKRQSQKMSDGSGQGLLYFPYSQLRIILIVFTEAPSSNPSWAIVGLVFCVSLKWNHGKAYSSHDMTHRHDMM